MESRPRGLGAPGPSKSGRERSVDLSRRLRRVLREFYLERGRPADEAFVLQGLDPSNFHEKEWRRIRQRSKLGTVRFKDLRDTFASPLLTAGVQLGYISRQLGHADVAVTAQHYARWVAGSEYRDPMARRPGEVPADFLARLPVASGDSPAAPHEPAQKAAAGGEARAAAPAPVGAIRRWEDDGRRKLVGRLGIEPRTNGLKARCSAS